MTLHYLNPLLYEQINQFLHIPIEINREHKTSQPIQNLTDRMSLTVYDGPQQEKQEQRLAHILHLYKDKLQNSIKMENSSQNEDQPIKIEETSYQPTPQEISDVIIELKQAFHPHNIDKLVSKLYGCLIMKRPNIKLHKFNESNNKFQYNIQQVSQNISKAVKRFIIHPQERKFRGPEEEQRHQEKMIIAKAFCNKDYGIKSLSQEIIDSGLNISIKQKRYKTLSLSIISEAYRKLQEFLIHECQKKIQKLHQNEIRLAFTTLLNCRRYFEHRLCLTFFKFVKIAFKIMSTTVGEEQSIDLYIQIQKDLKQKISEMQYNGIQNVKCKRFNQIQKFYLHKIWTSQLELEFLNSYKQKKQLLDVRNHFRKIYPQHRTYFTIQSLRSRLYKVLRFALKKINTNYLTATSKDMPALIKLNDMKIRYILRSPDAIYSRLGLIDLYLDRTGSETLLRKIITTVNSFLVLKEPLFLQNELKESTNDA